MKDSDFNRQLTSLQLLVWFKRSFRLMIRAMWLGLCGYLLAWGLNQLKGWLPDERIWLWLGVALAALPLAGIMLSWPPRKRLVWSLDRELELQEQVSTAWSVCSEGQENRVTEALLSDVRLILPRVRKRLLTRGWWLSRDVVALLIVLLLCGGVYIYRFLPVTMPTIDTVEVALLPPLGGEASAEDVLPDGLLGINPTPTPAPGGEGDEMGAGDSGAGEGMSQTIQDALSAMGEELSQNAATYELGQALQSGDAGEAASALENLSDQVEGLEAETLETLAGALEQAAESLSTLNSEAIQQLSQDMQDAASQIASDYLKEDSQSSGESADSSVQNALDALASDLRALDEVSGDGGGSGASAGGATGESGLALPAERLQGEGEELELGTNEALMPGMLTPASARSIGYQTGSDALSVLGDGGSEIIRTPLIPSYYAWKWRNVVSTYFLSR